MLHHKTLLIIHVVCACLYRDFDHALKSHILYNKVWPHTCSDKHKSINHCFGPNLQCEAAWTVWAQGLAFQSSFVLFCQSTHLGDALIKRLQCLQLTVFCLIHSFLSIFQ